jgi:hypothetical protein
VRAGFLRGRLAALDAVLGPERAAAIRSELGPAFCRHVQSRAMHLHPIDDEVAIIEAVDRTVGRSGMRAWSHDHAVGIARNGALGAILNNAIRLFGVTPHAMSWAAARGWTHVFRELGRLVHVGSDPARIVLRWNGAPAWVAEHVAFRATLESGLEACLTLARRQGEVLLALEGGELRFTMTCMPLRAVS